MMDLRTAHAHAARIAEQMRPFEEVPP